MQDYSQNPRFTDFMTACDVLRNAFDPGVDQAYWEIVNVICTTLMDDKNLPTYSLQHPFHKYSDSDSAHYNIAQLRVDVEPKATSRAERGAARSFFAQGGAHYDLLEDLMTAYWSFVDTVLANDDNNHHSDENDENDEDDNQYSNN